MNTSFNKSRNQPNRLKFYWSETLRPLVQKYQYQQSPPPEMHQTEEKDQPNESTYPNPGSEPCEPPYPENS
ncbi:MAG: hypothetical protein DDG60_00620 [Anaerolineae bacterium]|nr:MAG: hypothetical protein DDG60_00620 [Anaerolineae bacterium]